jgi:hypothetical protein
MKLKNLFIVFLSLAALCSKANTFIYKPIPAAVEDSIRFNRNGIYSEVYLIRHDFSNGFVSLNYERRLGKKNNMMLRVGIYPDFKTTISFPLTYTFISPARGCHHFEYGLGLVVRIESYEGNIYKDIPALMIPLLYRYENGKGFFARAGFNVFYSWPILPAPSISIGYSF